MHSARMAKRTIPLRLEEKTIDRADALIEALEERIEAEGLGQASRSTVLRMAIARGLTTLEAELGGGDR